MSIHQFKFVYITKKTEINYKTKINDEVVGLYKLRNRLRYKHNEATKFLLVTFLT